jgi:IS30 family transposase
MAAWTDEDQKTLEAMLEAGASARRIAVRLRRSVDTIKTRAKTVGKPFPLERELAKQQSKLKLGRVLINRRRCPLSSDPNRSCATAANVAMGHKRNFPSAAIGARSACFATS